MLNENADGTLTLKEIEHSLHCAQSTAHGLITRLEEKGFVISIGDPDDKRIRVVSITEKGIGYCVGGKLTASFHKVMRFSAILGLLLSTIMTGLCYLFTNQIVGVFITDPDAFSYGIRFVRILLTTSFLFGIYYVLLNAIQAMGAGTEALIMNLSRQGFIFIPALFILEAIIGIHGIVWAQPVADVLSMLLVIVLYRQCMEKML